MSITHQSDPRRAAPNAAPWLPDAWGTSTFASDASHGAVDAADDFVSGWSTAAPVAGPPRAADALAALDTLLPEFGAGRHEGSARAYSLDVERAADAREAAVRAELAAAHAAELGAREAAHTAALDAVWSEGHAAGVTAAEAAVHDTLDGAVRALDAATHEVRTHEERWMGDLRAHVAGLAIAVAHHVVGRAVAADDALVVALTARAIAEFPPGEALVARVHPDDLPALKEAWNLAPRDGEIRWLPDARVVRGGALVEGRERIVDGRVDAALERLYRALAGHAA